jgi:hypothetical protein
VKFPVSARRDEIAHKKARLSDTGLVDQTGGTGTVGLLLTGNTADPSLEAINASIEKAELIGSDDGRVVFLPGLTWNFDRLRLKYESIPFIFKDDVPVEHYCKIRLIRLKANRP